MPTRFDVFLLKLSADGGGEQQILNHWFSNCLLTALIFCSALTPNLSFYFIIFF